ncbi:MAG: nitrogen fixation protein NifZ, partial [Psychromonas sp.]
MDAKFDYGEKVRVIKNIRNDGTFMGSDRGALLIRRGSQGYIKGVGRFLQDQVIYQVHFIELGCTVGCRETELGDLQSPWVDREFERGDSVTV